MLVLSRKAQEEIVITVRGVEILIQVVLVQGDKARLGIEAPTEVTIHRREVHELIERQKLVID